jgi:AcrR family transcriptional regulator
MVAYVRTHGWAGDPPASDEEAIERILAAARHCLDECGPETSIMLVAESLGVTRQTIYRYFASTEALLTSVAFAAVADFLDRLAEHVAPYADPSEAILEGIAYGLEQVPSERYLNALLLSGKVATFAKGVTSETAMAFGRSILQRFPIDWAKLGYDDARLDDLTEYLLRLLQSFILDPGETPRRGAELRRFLSLCITLPGPIPSSSGPSRSTRHKP